MTPSTTLGKITVLGKRPRDTKPDITSPARVNRIAMKENGPASERAPLTITNDDPQIKVVITSRSSALVRWRKNMNLECHSKISLNQFKGGNVLLQAPGK